METLSSRKNAYIRHLRQLAAEGDYRRAQGEYLCEGLKTLGEALASGARLRSLLWKERPGQAEGIEGAAQYVAPTELFDYACPLRSSPGPLFCVEMPKTREEGALQRVIVLENVQDPGNVGTVVRTADAFGVDAVVLLGACADLYAPKTVRATMGAIFRQRVLTLGLEELCALLERQGLPLYGAALDPRAEDVRARSLAHAAVAVGSEGQGLSEALLRRCDGSVIIPIRPESESLNAAVAASVLMWEAVRGQGES